MDWIWCILFCAGTVYASATLGGDAALSAMLQGAGKAVTLCVSLAGATMFWMGLMEVAQEAGLIKKLSRALKRPCAWLFPGAEEATGAITLNIAANILGMGNAATPFGLTAMRIMQAHNPQKERATTAMCAFLAVNASALEVIPTTMIALRAAAGSSAPASVILPSLVSSAIATLAAIVVCRLLKNTP